MIETITVGGLEWFFNCVRPLEAVVKSIDCQRLEGRAAFFKQFWFIPVVITLFLNAPILASVSVNINQNLIVMGTLLLSFSLNQVIAGVILIVAVKIARINVDNRLVLGCYTVYVIYSPIIALAGLPATYESAVSLAIVKAQQLDLFGATSYYLRGLAKAPPDSVLNTSFYSNLSNCLSDAVVCIGLIETVLVAESLHQLATVDRFKSYFVVTAAAFLFALPRLLVFLVQIVLIWTAGN